ncbi:MAG TPA: hypothetical protein VIM12_13740 [Noviherbaspirillum sp.]|jgi:hypothetical protein|uniref:hypothetical protein n=1 Tax=Noviherbaspirillum sp. TaxID=1926288 RepID=UPI002F94B4C0
MKPATELLVEALVSGYAMSSDPQYQQLLREALCGLVRLAKMEKALEIKRDVARAAGIRI